MVWKPKRGVKGRGSKFALKIIVRGENDVDCKRVFNEKDVMLAVGKSPWHTELFNTFKTKQNLYMLLEFAPGLSVDQQIEWGRGLRVGGIPTIRFYTACALLAIEHMHKVEAEGEVFV